MNISPISYSFPGFQEDLEKGKAAHLFPAFFASERVKQGAIKKEDIPVSASVVLYEQGMIHFAFLISFLFAALLVHATWWIMG